MASVEGLDKVLSNIDKKEKAAYKAVRTGMDFGLTETVKHIKDNYHWQKDHKGFVDRTGNLRNSINHKVDTSSHFLGSQNSVIGWIYATMEYAPYVELKWEGRHAYLYPGISEKEDFILECIADALQEVINIFGI